MPAIRRHLVGAAFATCMTTAAIAQTEGQQPVAPEMPATQHQMDVLKKPAAQAPAADAAGPGPDSAGAAAPSGPCGTDMPATTHQADVLKTAEGCVEQGAAGTTTGPDGVARTQPDNQPLQQPQQ